MKQKYRKNHKLWIPWRWTRRMTFFTSVNSWPLSFCTLSLATYTHMCVHMNRHACVHAHTHTHTHRRTLMLKVPLYLQEDDQCLSPHLWGITVPSSHLADSPCTWFHYSDPSHCLKQTCFVLFKKSNTSIKKKWNNFLPQNHQSTWSGLPWHRSSYILYLLWWNLHLSASEAGNAWRDMAAVM